MTDSEIKRALIKSVPEDWLVYEQFDTPFTGNGEHQCFLIEKRLHNSADVARWLADQYRVPVQHVGYCGRKDKHAVTRQWFSVPTNLATVPDPRAASDMRCLETARHARKLRRGDHAGNHFQIRLREVRGFSADECSIAAQGFANAFGPQRFGGDNLDQSRTWLARQQYEHAPLATGGRRRRRRQSTQQDPQRGWHLSVLRSHLFNQVLAARVCDGTADRVLEGDVVVDGWPSGPLWGRGRSATTDRAAVIEQAALSAESPTLAALEHAGLQQARRALWCVPENFAVEPLEQDLLLSFDLPPGVYATELLRAICDCSVAARTEIASKPSASSSVGSAQLL